MKTFFLKLSILAAFVSASQADMSQTDAMKKAEAFIGNQSVTLKYAGEESWGSSGGKPIKCFQFVGANDDSLVIDVDFKTGNVLYFFWGERAARNKEKTVSQQQAEEIAVSFLRKKTSFTLNGFVLEKALFFDRKLGGQEFQFVWRQVKDNVNLPVHLRVHVGSQYGDITMLSYISHQLTLRSLNPKMSETEAFQLINKEVLAGSGELVNSQLVVAPPAASKFPAQTLAWELQIRGLYENPLPELKGQKSQVVFLYTVDATTGKVISWSIQRLLNTPQLNKPVQPKAISIVDFWPCWSRLNGQELIAFKSNRNLHQVAASPNLNPSSHGDPAQVNQETETKNVIAWSDGKEISALFVAPRHLFMFDISRDLRIAFWMLREIYILDLKQGKVVQLNDGHNGERNFPSWDITGRRLLTSGLHAVNSGYNPRDSDIFYNDIGVPLSLEANSSSRPVSIFPGADNMPIFLPPNVADSQVQNVVFVQAEDSKVDPSQTTWNIYGAGVATNLPTPETSHTPRRILSDIPHPERLSAFPDGQRILISYVDNDDKMSIPPEIIDVHSKTRTPLKLPPLYDPDLPEGKPLVARAVSVSPDGTRIAFSALRWSGDPKDVGAILIYTCDLDGKNLQRITPTTNTQTAFYKYPQKDVTALNAWEKLKPTMDDEGSTEYGDFVARDKRLRELRTKFNEIRKQNVDRKKGEDDQ